MFPHHENEIAQSRCAGHEFANVWMHNEMLQVEGKKMSKSLGNFFTVRDLLEQGVPGEVIRFVMLSTHYRKPMDWTEKKRQDAEKTILSWVRIIDQQRDEVKHRFTGDNPPRPIVEALTDDLNTSLAITRLREIAKSARASLEHRVLLAEGMHFLGFDYQKDWEVNFGFSLEKILDHSADFASFEAMLSGARAKAKQTKDFTEADRIKRLLVEAGLEVRIEKSAVRIDITDKFDPLKLEALK
ncbi:MAG: class I tRNA ligase family protein, partial [Roseobacter sp.]